MSKNEPDQHEFKSPELIIQPVLGNRLLGLGRLIITLGGKGGLAKTLTAVAIADYLHENDLPVKLIDCDEENDKAGCLKRFFPEAEKINIKKDLKQLDPLAEIALANPITLADLGASSGEHTFEWFGTQFPQLKEEGLKVTLVCLVTASAAGVDSLITWANNLKDAVDYVVVKNHRDGDDFYHLEQTKGGKAFLAIAKPPVIELERRAQDVTQELEARGLSHRRALLVSPEELGDFPEHHNASLSDQRRVPSN